MYSAYSINVPDYKSVLDILTERGETNTSQTSSLPLAAFWYPKRNKVQKDELFQGIGIRFDGLKPQDTEYNFEYPTPAYVDGISGKNIKHSNPSWTDLMIRLNDGKGTRITIEAKYIEYGKQWKEKEYAPLLKNWYDKPHKEQILQCWINYINKCFGNNSDRIPDAKVLVKENPELPYQFLHRTASACFNCERPILVYQLFYDNKNFKAMEKFRGHLNEWAKILRLNQSKLSFFIVETEVKIKECPNPDIWNNKSKENHSDLLFTKMIDNEQLYKFGDKVTVRDGYTLKEL